MKNKKEEKKVLFICTQNSARSQMAEGLVNALYRGRYTARSAGTEPSEVNSYAVRVMSEIGIDISSHHSKSVDQFMDQDFDYVVDHQNLPNLSILQYRKHQNHHRGKYH